MYITVSLLSSCFLFFTKTSVAIYSRLMIVCLSYVLYLSIVIIDNHLENFTTLAAKRRVFCTLFFWHYVKHWHFHTFIYAQTFASL